MPSTSEWLLIHRTFQIPASVCQIADVGTSLDQPGVPVRGDAHTVCNTGLGANVRPRLGIGADPSRVDPERVIVWVADLSSTPPVLLSVDAQSQSGQPASPNYGDQLAAWSQGRYYSLSVDRNAVAGITADTMNLEPFSNES